MYVSDGLTAKSISDLMQELESGQYKKEILPNSSYEMSGERQAMYFSHARENLKTDIAHAVMYSNQQLEDYQLLGAFHERT